MGWVAEFIVPLVAVLGSVLGIFVALDQVTAAARLRRKAIFWREIAKDSHVEQDAAVLHSLQRETTAKLVALDALPLRKFAIPTWFAVNGLAISTTSGFILGAEPVIDLSWDQLYDRLERAGLDPAIWLVVSVMVMLGVAGCLNILVDRTRIAEDFIKGEKLRIRSKMRTYAGPGLPPVLEALGAGGFLWLNVMGASVTSLSVALGGYLATWNRWSSDLPPLWLGLATLGGFVGLIPVFAIWMRLEQVRKEWGHPGQIPQQVRPSASRLPADTKTWGHACILRLRKLFRRESRPRNGFGPGHDEN